MSFTDERKKLTVNENLEIEEVTEWNSGQLFDASVIFNGYFDVNPNLKAEFMDQLLALFEKYKR